MIFRLKKETVSRSSTIRKHLPRLSSAAAVTRCLAFYSQTAPVLCVSVFMNEFDCSLFPDAAFLHSAVNSFIPFMPWQRCRLRLKHCNVK